MKINPVSHCTFIIRSQVEYSTAAQAVILRCLLEIPATGERRGFTDLETLLTVLGTELLEMQSQIIPSGQQNLENPSEPGVPPACCAARSTNADTPTESGSP
jgi:hypothetical protein